MIVLDTDHLSVLENAENEDAKLLREKLRTCHDRDIRVTVISIEEQMRGWLAAIRRQRTTERLIVYYDRLIETVEFFSRWRALRFEADSAHRFDELRAQRIRIEHKT